MRSVLDHPVASTSLRRLLDRPVAPGAIALSAGFVLVVLRLVFAAHGDIASFIVVGSKHVARTGLPSGIPVIHGTGYDGQFYFRQSLDPFDTARTASGIVLDGRFRLERLGYPLVVYLLSGGGQVGAVPIVLVAVNVLGLGLVGFFGGLLAAEAGRHACYGLLLPAYFGFVMTLSRDLLEIVEVSFVLAAVLAFRRGRYVLAGLGFACAVVTKETDVATVTGYAIAIAIASLARNRRFRLAPWVSVALPAAGFLAVQLWLRVVTGHIALRSGARGNLATPFVAAVHAFAHYASHPFVLANAIWLGEIGVLGLVVLIALLTFRRTNARLEEKVALVVLVALAVSLSAAVWNGQADFRSLAPVYALSCVVLLSSKRRLGFVIFIVAAALAVGVVHRILFI